jgi:hypothetical protein
VKKHEQVEVTTKGLVALMREHFNAGDAMSLFFDLRKFYQIQEEKQRRAA